MLFVFGWIVFCEFVCEFILKVYDKIKDVDVKKFNYIVIDCFIWFNFEVGYRKFS